MVLKLWLCAIAMVSVTTSILVDHVPNQCPPEPGEYPVIYGHPDDCQYFFLCDHGSPVLRQCGEGERWSDVFRVCVGYNTHFDTCTRENAERECMNGYTGLIPHPSACQRYYNCSKPEPMPGPIRIQYLSRYEDECPYPQAFDVLAKECRPYNQAYCGPYRWLAKEPCDYVKNKCSRIAHCIPCESRIPSCAGLADGNHAISSGYWSQAYIQCADERNIGLGRSYCGRHSLTDTPTLFSPLKGECVSEWEIPREQGGLAPSCDGKAPGQSYQADNRPDVYYSCPDARVSYCGLGNVFNESAQQCEASQ